MTDELKSQSISPQAGAAVQKGVQIRTMKSDIEALQKKPGAPTPALKPAIPPSAGGFAPAVSVAPKPLIPS
ncbi:MAG: hypothetical protein AAB851_02275, partial [Patescibacteria group bacterium]